MPTLGYDGAGMWIGAMAQEVTTASKAAWDGVGAVIEIITED